MRKKINVWMAIVLLFGMITPQLLVPLEAAASGPVVLSQSFEDGQTGGWVKVEGINRLVPQIGPPFIPT